MSVLVLVGTWTSPRRTIASGNKKQAKLADIGNNSIGNCRHGYKQPDDQLALLVQSLPALTHLDISGTNLAGPRKRFRAVAVHV